MCGPENTNRPRGGALVALNPPISSSQNILRGDLALHVPGDPASTDATHVRLTPSEACDMSGLVNPYIVIHSSGDMTKSACDCGIFRKLAFPTSQQICNQEYIEFPLNKPLSLEVGGEGVIGRRVSLYSRHSTATRDVVVAEGIVGFNFLSQETVSEASSARSSPSP